MDQTVEPRERVAQAPSRRQGLELSNRTRERLAGYLFVAPDAIGLLIFVGGPMILSLSLGFFNVSGFGEYAFVGLANYRRMVGGSSVLEEPAGHDPLYRDPRPVALCDRPRPRAACAERLPVQRLRPQPAVHAPDRQPRRRRTGLAGACSSTRSGFSPSSARRSASLAISWLGDPRFALYVVVAISVWFLMGFYMLIFLGGLQDIPREYYEAARIDGAGPVQAFFKITLPLLQPTSFFVLLVSTVAAVCGSQTFDLIYVMTRGGPANSTSLAIFYIYQQAFLFNEYGYAAAMASVLVVVLMAITVLMFMLTRGGRFIYG